MNVEEARVAIGFTTVASVMYALKHGKIRARQNGEIIDSSVRAYVARREESAVERALFLKDDLSASETKALRTKPKAK
jgi:electron transfer flavoprotein alpha/beta subunit